MLGSSAVCLCKDWSPVVRLLLVRNLVRVVADATVPQRLGRRVLPSAFLVTKRSKNLPDVRQVDRVIMDIRQTKS